MQTIVIDGRTCRKAPVVRIECTVGFRYVETLRSRLARFVKAHVIDDEPERDESHAATRYRGRGNDGR
ncbi:MAG: hypothetical protein WC815_23850 [Vicinamibacterales bacterium]|jgi:hypothetical protein